MNLFIQLPPSKTLSTDRDAEPLILAVDAIESIHAARVQYEEPGIPIRHLLGSTVAMKSGERHLVAKTPREIAWILEQGLTEASLRPAPPREDALS